MKPKRTDSFFSFYWTRSALAPMWNGEEYIMSFSHNDYEEGPIEVHIRAIRTVFPIIKLK